MTGVRKIVSRSPHRRVGRIACPWFQQCAIEYESLLERDFVRIALLNSEISAIIHQPFFVDLGEHGRYIPDFLLLGPKKNVVVEVKPDKHANNSRNKPRLSCAAELLARQGYKFLVASEITIHAGGRHERAALLLRYARSHLAPALVTNIVSAAARYPGGISIRDLAADAAVPTQAVLQAIGRRHLRIGTTLACGEDDLVHPV